MFRYFALSFFLLVSHVSVSQTSINDYAKLLENASSFEEKKKAFKKIDQLTYGKDYPAFIRYSNRFADIAIQHQEFDIAANTIVDICGVYTKTGVPEKVISAVNKILPYEHLLENSRNKGNIFLKRAAYYYHGRDFRKSVGDYSLAIKKFSDKDSIFIADALFFRGQAYSYLADLLNAIKDYEKAVLYYRNLKDEKYVINTYASLALLYSDNGFYKEANKIRARYVDDAIEKGNYRLAAVTFHNKAVEAYRSNKLKECETQLLQAERLFKKLENNDYGGLARVYCMMVELYAEQGEIEKAQKYLAKVEAKQTILQNNNLVMISYYQAKSILEKAEKNYALSLNLLKKSTMLSKNWKNVREQIRNEKLFYDLYQKIGNNRKALTHYQKYNALKDSVFSIQKTNALLYYQNLYESERKEKSLQEKEADIKLLEKTNTIRTNWMIFGGFGLCFLFGFFFILKQKSESDRKKELQEVYSQKLILAQENERKRIANELHDSLGQNLLMIKNQLVSNDSEDLKSLTNNTINEMRSIAMNLHPYQLQEFGLTKAVQMNLKKFEQNNVGIFVSYELDDIDDIFNEAEQLNIYRIIQECITNIVKHAKASAARFVFEKKENAIQITINDNGKGYNFQKSLLNKSSLGLKTIQERINLLKGVITVFSEKNKGSKIEIEIPIL